MPAPGQIGRASAMNHTRTDRLDGAAPGEEICSNIERRFFTRTRATVSNEIKRVNGGLPDIRKAGASPLCVEGRCAGQSRPKGRARQAQRDEINGKPLRTVIPSSQNWSPFARFARAAPRSPLD